MRISYQLLINLEDYLKNILIYAHLSKHFFTFAIFSYLIIY